MSILLLIEAFALYLKLLKYRGEKISIHCNSLILLWGVIFINLASPSVTPKSPPRHHINALH